MINPLDRVIQSLEDLAKINKALPSFFFFVKYYEECHGVIYVIDSSDERRLEESQVTFGEYKLLTVFQFNIILYLCILNNNYSIILFLWF